MKIFKIYTESEEFGESAYQDAERILKEFNFEEVQQHMQRVGWTWSTREGDRVPSIEELHACAQDLLRRLIFSEEPIYRIGTGGFQAVQFPWGIELFFVIQGAR